MKDPLALRRWIFAVEVDDGADDFLNSAGEAVSEEAARFDPFIGDAWSAHIESNKRTNLFEQATGQVVMREVIHSLGRVQEGARP